MWARLSRHHGRGLFSSPSHFAVRETIGSRGEMISGGRTSAERLPTAVLRTELWAGNRERWRHMLRPSHSIRSAWSNWARHRYEYAEHLGREEYAGLVVLRLRHPTEAERAVRFLAAAAGDLSAA